MPVFPAAEKACVMIFAMMARAFSFVLNVPPLTDDMYSEMPMRPSDFHLWQRTRLPDTYRFAVKEHAI